MTGVPASEFTCGMGRLATVVTAALAVVAAFAIGWIYWSERGSP